MTRERHDDVGRGDLERYRAITEFGEDVIIYDVNAEGAWIESDTWLTSAEYQ